MKILIDGVKLFALCADRGITKKQLKEGTGLSFNTIAKITEERCCVKTTTLGVVARFLNVKSIDLIKTEEK